MVTVPTILGPDHIQFPRGFMGLLKCTNFLGNAAISSLCQPVTYQEVEIQVIEKLTQEIDVILKSGANSRTKMLNLRRTFNWAPSIYSSVCLEIEFLRGILAMLQLFDYEKLRRDMSQATTIIRQLSILDSPCGCGTIRATHISRLIRETIVRCGSRPAAMLSLSTKLSRYET